MAIKKPKSVKEPKQNIINQNTKFVDFLKIMSFICIILQFVLISTIVYFNRNTLFKSSNSVSFMIDNNEKISKNKQNQQNKNKQEDAESKKEQKNE